MDTVTKIGTGIILVLCVALCYTVGLGWYHDEMMVVNGTVTSVSTYPGAGEIGGFASGSTGQLTYYILIVSYNNQAIRETVTCGFYTVGSQMPVYYYPNTTPHLQTDYEDRQVGC